MFPRIEDNPHGPIPPWRGGSLSFGGPVARRPSVEEDHRPTDLKLTEIGYSNLHSVNRLNAPRPTRSLSNTKIPLRAFKQQVEDNMALWMGTGGAMRRCLPEVDRQCLHHARISLAGSFETWQR